LHVVPGEAAQLAGSAGSQRRWQPAKVHAKPAMQSFKNEHGERSAVVPVVTQVGPVASG